MFAKAVYEESFMQPGELTTWIWRLNHVSFTMAVHLRLDANKPWLMLLLFLPCPFPFPPPRRYDSLDSATNGRSDLDSASGSSRRTSRQYSLDSRRSLSDRWVSVAPSLHPSLPAAAPACNSLPLWWCRGFGHVWFCGPCCACMHAHNPLLLHALFILIIYTYVFLYLLFSTYFCVLNDAT